MLNEIQYVLRTLRQNPGFALTAILSIALAVGANSTIFSCANGALLRPLPVPNPSQVLTLRSVPLSVSSLPVRGYSQSRMSYPDFRDYRRGTRSFDGLVAYSEIVVAFADTANAQPEFKLGYEVSGDFFKILKIEPQLGRGFGDDEAENPGSDPVIVLSHDLWRNEFGQDTSVIGRRVLLNSAAFTVIGVAPESFTGMDQFLRPDFFVPVATGSKLAASGEQQQSDRSLRRFIIKGRLKSGISMRAAASEASAIARSLEDLYPATNRGLNATVNTEREFQLISWPILGSLAGALFIMAFVILLIACANVANLMLGRGRSRAREIAVRLAVGASRGRLIRLLLIESLLIAVASGPLALVAAQFTSGIFSSIDLPSDFPIHLDFHVDQRVLWFTTIVSVLSALLFGLVPAIHATKLDLASVMKAGELDSSRGRLLGRRALVVVQIAGCMVLLMLAAAGRRNFSEVLAGNPGFRRDHRITMRFNPAVTGYTADQAQRFYERLVQKATEVTGVKSAALTSGLPLTNDRENEYVVPEGYQFPAGSEGVEVLGYVVDHHFFDTFGVPLIAGRAFRATDDAAAPRVAIVNDAFARQYLGPNPLGKKLRLGERNGPALEVVGVAITGKTFVLVEPPVQAIYLPLAQNPRPWMTLIAETTGDPARLAGPLKNMVRSIDPNIAVFRVRTMDDIFEHSSVATIRMVGRIYDFAAASGLLLAIVGLYAVVNYQVARRTREIGIRMALGANRPQVINIFLSQALMMSLAGVLIGVVMGLFASRLSESALGASALDPLLILAVCAALLLTTTAAALIPARNAARVDPQQTLRQN